MNGGLLTLQLSTDTQRSESSELFHGVRHRRTTSPHRVHPSAISRPGSVSSACSPVSEQGRDVLYGEFRPLVLRLIRKYGDNAELRKDLEGEIFCLFNDLLDAFDPARGVPLKAYLVHQLTTSVYTLARRQWRQEKREVSFELREDTTGDRDPSHQWDDAIILQKVRDMLPTAIAQLPLRQRQVVIWRYYEHRSFEEIAESLGGVQAATARSLLRHGMNSLRRSFEKANVSIDGADAE